MEKNKPKCQLFTINGKLASVLTDKHTYHNHFYNLCLKSDIQAISKFNDINYMLKLNTGKCLMEMILDTCSLKVISFLFFNKNVDFSLNRVCVTCRKDLIEFMLSNINAKKITKDDINEGLYEALLILTYKDQTELLDLIFDKGYIPTIEQKYHIIDGAICYEAKNALKYLVQKYNFSIDDTEYPEYPIIHAIEGQKYNITTFMIDELKINTNIYGKDKNHLIIKAVNTGKVDIMKKINTDGINLSEVFGKFSLLNFASIFGNISVVKYIMNDLNVKYDDLSLETAIRAGQYLLVVYYTEKLGVNLSYFIQYNENGNFLIDKSLYCLIKNWVNIEEFEDRFEKTFYHCIMLIRRYLYGMWLTEMMDIYIPLYKYTNIIKKDQDIALSFIKGKISTYLVQNKLKLKNRIENCKIVSMILYKSSCKVIENKRMNIKIKTLDIVRSLLLYKLSCIKVIERNESIFHKNIKVLIKQKSHTYDLLYKDYKVIFPKIIKLMNENVSNILYNEKLKDINFWFYKSSELTKYHYDLYKNYQNELYKEYIEFQRKQKLLLYKDVLNEKDDIFYYYHNYLYLLTDDLTIEHKIYLLSSFEG